MRIVTLVLGLCLVGGCTSEGTQTAGTAKPIIRGVHTGEKTKVGFYYTIFPTCESEGYTEITVVKAPKHGRVSSDQGQDYPNFARDNVRWECNRKLVPSTQVFYQSDAGFQGKDAFSITVRSPSSGVRTDYYDVQVMPTAQ